MNIIIDAYATLINASAASQRTIRKEFGEYRTTSSNKQVKELVKLLNAGEALIASWRRMHDEAVREGENKL